MLELALHRSAHSTKRAKRLTSPDRFLLNLCILLLMSAVASGQTASVRGQVVDQSGAVIPRATVTLTAPSGLVKTTTAAENGFYSFAGLTTGQYTARAAAPKLEQEPDYYQARHASSAARNESGRCAAADHGSREHKYIRQHGISFAVPCNQSA